VLGWVHCGIYKSSYSISNMSYLNSLPPPLSFILSSLLDWTSSFKKALFSSLAYFFTESLIFWEFSFLTSCIFCSLIPCHTYNCQRFPPILWETSSI
jgi:hypothetical protein